MGNQRGEWETLRRRSDGRRQEATGVTLSVARAAAVVAGNAAAPLMTRETRRLCVLDHRESTFHALTSLARNSIMVAGFFFSVVVQGF